MFLQAASSVGFADAGKLKKQIERISKNTAINDFLNELSAHLTPSNTISSSQWTSFQKLDEAGETVELPEVLETIRYEQHKQKRLKQEAESLEKQLSAAKSRQTLLEKQLKCLEATHVATINHEDDLSKLVKASVKETLHAKSDHKEVRKKNKYNKQCILSLVDLDTFLLSEDEYSSQLTQYAKRQFHEVPSIVESLSNSKCELNSIADTVLLQDECKEVKSALLEEIKRATNGYKNRKKRGIFSKADVARAEATLKFLKSKASALKYGSCQDNRHTGALQNAIASVDQQISYTVNAVLPGLLSKGLPLQKNKFLTGDFRNKLSEQQKITQKQKNLIELLLQQCSRLTVLWMMLQFEKTQVSVLSNKMKNLSVFITKALDASNKSCQNLNVIQQTDQSNKEPKAVIGTRDFVMLDLHKLLTSTSDQPDVKVVFHTVESAFQAASLLSDQQKSLLPCQSSCRSKDSRLLTLSDSIRHLLWENIDPASVNDDIILTSQSISDSLNSLQERVDTAKMLVPKLLTKSWFELVMLATNDIFFVVAVSADNHVCNRLKKTEIGMVASALYILDLKGKVLISRNYRGDIPMNAIDAFPKLLMEQEDEGTMNPVLQHGDMSFVFVKFNNLYMVATTNKNSNVMMITSFMHKLCQIFAHYFKELEEESIKDNFVIVYELFDEVMDFGYPQFSDPKILQEYITQESHKLEVQVRPPSTVTNAVSWRSEGLKYRKNEVFLDVIESVNLLVSANGNVLRSEIVGSVKMRVFLSGMPELRLGLNDKVLFQNTGRSKSKAVEMEDVKFHQCVRLSRFENDRTISFIPPDGEFELMSYRLNTHVKPLIWIESVIERHSHSRVEIMVKAKSQFKRRSTANNVEIQVPVPADADSPKFKTSVGSVKWVPETNNLVWTIKSFPGGKEYLMRAHFGLPSVESEELEGKPPISVKFEIPYFTTSGIQVRYLKIIEKSGYQALPWVRYITQNGDYQLRTN